MKKNVLLLGSSHIGSMAMAQSEMDCSSLKSTYAFKFIMDFRKDSRIVEPIAGDFENASLNKELEEYLSSLSGVDAIVLSISGSDYLPLCISMPPQLFDFILPDEQELPLLPGAALIPYAEVKEKLRRDIRHVIMGLKLIRSKTSIPVFYIESPPPIEDNDHIVRNAGWAAPAIDKFGPSPALLRYKFWRLHSNIVKEACQESGTPFLDLPRSLLNENGFLPSEAFLNDLMHANKRFGSLLLNYIDSRI